MFKIIVVIILDLGVTIARPLHPTSQDSVFIHSVDMSVEILNVMHITNVVYASIWEVSDTVPDAIDGAQ